MSLDPLEIVARPAYDSPAPFSGNLVIRALSSLRRPLTALVLGASTSLTVAPVLAQGFFDAGQLVQERFVLVAAPIGTSDRYQLNIYEQVSDRRPCFAYGTSLPTAVNPLLATFDFTGICNRYIDANGYSLRIGGTDLASQYRLTVRNDAGGTLLIAAPAKEGAGPEMLVARSGGPISGFHRLQFEPGWMLMRRQFKGRRLGHVYIYRELMPGAAGQPAPATSPVPASTPAAASPAAPAGAPASAPGSSRATTPPPPVSSSSAVPAAGSSGARATTTKGAQPSPPVKP